jgi:glycosyltransferase involved in cell wall biosynthesis
MKTPLVSIILLNYNNLEFNTACIQSISAQSYKHFEIVFINNESKDGSIEEVQRVFSKEINDNSASGPAGQIIIAEPGSNLGFA